MANNRVFGGNGHTKEKLIDAHPDLPQLIQRLIDDGVKQKDMPQALSDDHDITIGQRSVERIIKTHALKTTRHSGLSDLEKTTAILAVSAEDSLDRWGGRKIKEKLAVEGIHVPREYINKVRATQNPEASIMRHPGTKKVHKSGLHCSGPDEEWCADGHEKLLSMGLSIYGFIDKFSRRELSLHVVPTSRTSDVPPALYLMLVRSKGGIPIQTTTDMGSETGILAALQTSLRQAALPELDIELVPAHRSVKSVHNITRERNWRPLWEKELSSIKFDYESGQIAAGYHPEDTLHQDFARWVWAKAVQHRLDKHVRENGRHHIRTQKKSRLPTGGRIKDFYEHPDRYGGRAQLIQVDLGLVDRLIEEHTPSDLFQFASTPEMELVCGLTYAAIGSPEISSLNAWPVFTAMVNTVKM
ncbi:hypothetical protein HMN09_01197300 [Mycena chlorophos]|uniref:Integrase catalytic domain-containing protein n=1 Tax=Mycena chlorophos TaxID=658473 RepID=A0A8H6VWY3_MYCCL|nr:hypothetical protein HMN09_01197300 [Mycena chlorophos]